MKQLTLYKKLNHSSWWLFTLDGGMLLDHTPKQTHTCQSETIRSSCAMKQGLKRQEGFGGLRSNKGRATVLISRLKFENQCNKAGQSSYRSFLFLSTLSCCLLVAMHQHLRVNFYVANRSVSSRGIRCDDLERSSFESHTEATFTATFCYFNLKYPLVYL